MPDEELARLKAERDAAEDERDDAQATARDFAKALQEIAGTESPDFWRIATEALRRHPEYDS